MGFGPMYVFTSYMSARYIKIRLLTEFTISTIFEQLQINLEIFSLWTDELPAFAHVSFREKSSSAVSLNKLHNKHSCFPSPSNQ